jgi:hypothetical protein
MLIQKLKQTLRVQQPLVVQLRELLAALCVLLVVVP